MSGAGVGIPKSKSYCRTVLCEMLDTSTRSLSSKLRSVFTVCRGSVPEFQPELEWIAGFVAAVARELAQRMNNEQLSEASRLFDSDGISLPLAEQIRSPSKATTIDVQSKTSSQPAKLQPHAHLCPTTRRDMEKHFQMMLMMLGPWARQGTADAHDAHLWRGHRDGAQSLRPKSCTCRRQPKPESPTSNLIPEQQQ